MSDSLQSAKANLEKLAELCRDTAPPEPGSVPNRPLYIEIKELPGKHSKTAFSVTGLPKGAVKIFLGIMGEMGLIEPEKYPLLNNKKPFLPFNPGKNAMVDVDEDGRIKIDFAFVTVSPQSLNAFVSNVLQNFDYFKDKRLCDIPLAPGQFEWTRKMARAQRVQIKDDAAFFIIEDYLKSQINEAKERYSENYSLSIKMIPSHENAQRIRFRIERDTKSNVGRLYGKLESVFRGIADIMPYSQSGRSTHTGINIMIEKHRLKQVANKLVGIQEESRRTR